LTGVVAPSVLAPGVLVLSVAGIGSPGSPRQSRQSSAVARPPIASPCGELWLGVLRVFRGRPVRWVRIYF